MRISIKQKYLSILTILTIIPRFLEHLFYINVSLVLTRQRTMPFIVLSKIKKARTASMAPSDISVASVNTGPDSPALGAWCSSPNAYNLKISTFQLKEIRIIVVFNVR